MSSIEDSNHFQTFAKVVERSIAKYGHLPEDDMIELQRKQVEGLSKLEKDFQKALLKDPNGEAAYLAFIAYILDDKKNILAARPYFREPRSFFASNISAAIRKRDVKQLREFHVNFQFVHLVAKCLVFGPKVNKIVEKIKEARWELVIMNLPLVINRANIFWSRTHKSHLSFMDLVQVGTEGLISAIDKYYGQYGKMYAGVIVGRCVGNLIENYSSTMLHFYPADKRKIYRANKFKARYVHGDYDTEDLVKYVNKAVGNETDSEELLGLMAASSIVSADAMDNTVSDNISIPNTIARYAAPEEGRPDVQVESQEANKLMQEAISKLSLFDKKILRLKGVAVSLE